MFDKKREKNILTWILSDPYIFSCTINILQPSYFHEENREIIEHVIKFYNKTQKCPTLDILEHELPHIENISSYFKKVDYEPEHQKYILETIENYCKIAATANFVLETAKHLEKSNKIDETLLRKIEDIVSISIDTDLGLNYKSDPEERLKKYSQQTKTIPTHIPELDQKLQGGFRKGELNIFAGSTGTGKSLFLQNITANWLMSGKNVIYYTLELSEELVASRIDCILTGKSSSFILQNVDESPIIIKNVLNNCKGNLYIKYIEAGSTINDIIAHLKNFQKQADVEKIDAIIIDYMDLMKPASVNINMSDLFVKDKYVSEEIRKLAAKLDVLCVTASQLNREAISDEDIALNHVAGGISKANTADNFIGIKKMLEKYKLFFLKTRNNDSAGSIIDVPFNPVCLKIGGENPVEKYSSSNQENKKQPKNIENTENEVDKLLKKAESKKSKLENIKRKNGIKRESEEKNEKNNSFDNINAILEKNKKEDKNEIKQPNNNIIEIPLDSKENIDKVTNEIFKSTKPTISVNINDLINNFKAINKNK